MKYSGHISAQELLSEYPYRIELHAHTSPCSGCCTISAKELIRLMKEQGYDAVAVTNHFFSPFFERCRNNGVTDPVSAYLADFHEAKEEGRKAGIKVYLGAEYRFSENKNDYLVYGADEAFLRKTASLLDMGIEAFYRTFHREDLLVIQAHPFRDHTEGPAVQISADFLDGVEIMNMHPGKQSRVALAAKYAVAHGYPLLTVGTDLHHRGHEGVSALRARILPENEQQLVELLKSRDYIFEIGGLPMLPY